MSKVAEIVQRNGNLNQAQDVAVSIPQLRIGKLRLKLIGDSSMLVHRFSDKVKKEIMDKQTGKAAHKKAPRDIAEEVKSCLYPLPGGKGYGFPASGFKKAMVNACAYVDAMHKTYARGAFHVDGDLVKLVYDEMVTNEMSGRINGKIGCVIYRPEFKGWSCTLDITYNAAAISPEQVVNLANIAGFAVGVGDFRPERSGQFGRFHVEVGDEA